MTLAGRGEAPPRITVDELTKIYGGGRGHEVPAVDRVSFDIRQGQFVALIGPSGCGKSTILNMIAGLIPTSGGRIMIDDHTVALGKLTPKVGYVFQRDTVYPWRTVRRNIGYGLELGRRPRAERDAEVARMIVRAGLDGFENAFPITLSGGMRQRVSLMRTLIMRPEILLMDEPFGALDTHTKLEMHKFLLEIWDEEKQTVLFVTHDLGEALTLSDKIIVLSARPGRIKEIFDVPFARPRDTVTLRETAEYSALFSEIWHSLGEEFRKTSAEG
jgi:NitT/TauT family transport system ATP-binding protein